MTDFNQLHKLANELEEFSSKTLNENVKIKPKPITSGALLTSSTEEELFLFNAETEISPKITTVTKTMKTIPNITRMNKVTKVTEKAKKTWPSSPSLKFFSSPEVAQLEKKQLNSSTVVVNKVDMLDVTTSKNDLNPHTLLNSMDNISPLKEEKTLKKNQDANLNWKYNEELSATLNSLGFVSVEDKITQKEIVQDKITQDKKNAKAVTFAEISLNKNIKSQAFTFLHKELGFSLSAFILDLTLNFSVFVLINSFYKIFTSVSLFQLSSLKFFFLFSLTFQLCTFIQRFIFKKTFGEWYTHVQLGTEKQQAEILFSLSLFWRSFVLLFTGVIILPVVSFFINKDLTYYLTDLQTFKRIGK